MATYLWSLTSKRPSVPPGNPFAFLLGSFSQNSQQIFQIATDLLKSQSPLCPFPPCIS